MGISDFCSCLAATHCPFLLGLLCLLISLEPLDGLLLELLAVQTKTAWQTISDTDLTIGAVAMVISIVQKPTRTTARVVGTSKVESKLVL